MAEVLQVMDPGASVQEGSWVIGPDGRRDRDVWVEGTVEGKRWRTLVECKDYDPLKTGTVGIELVDALDSKRRDLPCDLAIICSNAGFTVPAVHKAARVGIGLIGVMRQGDQRIRFLVKEEVFTRRLKLEALRMSLEGPKPSDVAALAPEEITFNGASLAPWVAEKALGLIGLNPIVDGAFAIAFGLVAPIQLHYPGGMIEVTRISIHVEITGGWFVHRLDLDATNAVHDWMRHRVRPAPGSGKFMIKDLNPYGGEAISRPPAREIESAMDQLKGEIVLKIALISGLPKPEGIPALDALINPVDLDLIMKDLPEASCTSSGWSEPIQALGVPPS